MADPLTETQLQWLRDELGPKVKDDDLQARYADLGSVRDTALAVLRDQRSRWLNNPMSISVPGVTLNVSENVKAIERRITALLKLDSDPSDNPEDDPGVGDAPVDMRPIQFVRTRRR